MDKKNLEKDLAQIQEIFLATLQSITKKTDKPKEDGEEEVKEGQPANDEEGKVIDTGDQHKPFKRMNSKYDAQIYTTEQLEVLEKIDANLPLTDQENAIKDKIENLRQQNDLHGLFGDEDDVKEEDCK